MNAIWTVCLLMAWAAQPVETSSTPTTRLYVRTIPPGARVCWTARTGNHGRSVPGPARRGQAEHHPGRPAAGNPTSRDLGGPNHPDRSDADKACSERPRPPPG
jgi:hypothetical protein